MNYKYQPKETIGSTKSNTLIVGMMCLLATLTGCEGDVGKTNQLGAAAEINQPITNLVFAPAAAVANAPEPLSTFTELDTGDEILTLDELQSLVFTPHCASCHTGQGDDLPASLDLSNGADTYASTIGTPSSEDPRLAIIEPEQSTNSYLVRKIEGTQSVGQRMPLNQEPLPVWVIAAIKRWVDAGAVF